MANANTQTKPANKGGKPANPVANPVANPAAILSQAPSSAPVPSVTKPNLLVESTGALMRPHMVNTKPLNMAGLQPGQVTLTAKGQALKPGGVNANALAWAAITAALASGKPQTLASLASVAAQAVGGGFNAVAHLQYRVKGGTGKVVPGVVYPAGWLQVTP